MRAEQILPDHLSQVERNGTTIRKGTVAAFLANARVLIDPTQEPGARDEAEADLIAMLPALRATGLFEVLEIRDPALRAWVQAH
ncbi:hypothetical protein [Paraburkholderia ferrariae]|jgi:hypothetical protein|uniref:hypothetical protein n=1 Tax=Paraburkholderia ferrariae TaxID=386056 RepID=UPI000484D671|nr:hypothetical protein [Paraburkholderia ferrariae]